MHAVKTTLCLDCGSFMKDLSPGCFISIVFHLLLYTSVCLFCALLSVQVGRGSLRLYLGPEAHERKHCHRLQTAGTAIQTLQLAGLTLASHTHTHTHTHTQTAQHTCTRIEKHQSPSRPLSTHYDEIQSMTSISTDE